jgi:acyl-CoA reductase-like NAD-dependent aldehyde dehydrogenase/4-aminobutyrate aminotransferase-like enzyme
MSEPRGDFLGGRWTTPEAGGAIRSVDPATDGQVVFEARSSPDHAREAARLADRQATAWVAASQADRVRALRRFARELEPRVEGLARAITTEMGKTLREARQEAQSLVTRIDMAVSDQLPRVATWSAPGVAGECRYHPLGVVAVIGPYNYPLHLLHAHVVPALLAGNTVVIKPSERTPWAGQRYVEAFAAAGLPPVLQMVQGGPDVGAALLAAPEVRGVVFTGSWRAGQAIARALSDRPEVLAALEMGGQNHAIVLEDADLDQALEGILLGGFLTTGQRCTGTSRVLVDRRIAERVIDRLRTAARELPFGPPTEDVFMGPLASFADRERVDALCATGVAAGAEVLLPASRLDGGAYRGPSLHLVRADHRSAYLEEEVFGPDVAITVIDGLEEAIGLVNASPYGLSLSLFSARRAALEKVYQETRVGCVNWNRSTNRAAGVLPFGGVGRSGNYRPAGADAIRNLCYPVQVLWHPSGELEGDRYVRATLEATDPAVSLVAMQLLEEASEPYAVWPRIADGWLEIAWRDLDPSDPSSAKDLAERLCRELGTRGVRAESMEESIRTAVAPGLEPSRVLAGRLADALHAIRSAHPARFLGRRRAGTAVPHGGTAALERSTAWLERLYRDDLVVRDKKPVVIDLARSQGPYLASVDNPALCFFDAAGQIATHAGGANPDLALEALATGRLLGSALRAAPDPAAPEFAVLAAILRANAGPGLEHVALCNSGAEANELAIRTAARERPGRRVLCAFEGAFHGRSLLALHTTWNPAKRVRFELQGFEARWVPWPATPEAEARSLAALDAALADDAVVCVLSEPMQSEGGDRHASPGFFAGVRAVTRARGVPLLCDEVQTGFHLGGPFFWHQRFELAEGPDLVTCGKKAQVGAVLSRWPIPQGAEAAPLSAARGALQAQMLDPAGAARMESNVRSKLTELATAHPRLVLAPRAVGYAFAFDLPTPEVMNQLLADRLDRGYMVYGAGDRTLRFRLHPGVDERALGALFARLDTALDDLGRERALPAPGTVPLPDPAPAWPPARAALPDAYRLEQVGPESWAALAPAVARLQERVYEPARRDDLEHLGALLADPDAIGLCVFKGLGLPPRSRLMGTAFAYPLEHAGLLDGPCQDPMRGRGNTLYSADVTVDPDARGQGVGLALKQAQVAAAMEARRPDGTPRYEHLTGRNRVGVTPEMQALNQRFGAWEVARYARQYGDPAAEAVYYRIPLTAPRLPGSALGPPRAPEIEDLDSGALSGPASEPVLRAMLQAGRLNGALTTKLCLSNFVTPGIVRAMELLRVLAPKGLPHLVLSNGRSEIVDKGLRAAKYHRPKGRLAIAIGPVQAGLVTAAARSLTHPPDDPENWFGWPRTADPTRAPEVALREVKELLERHGEEAFLAAVIEPVYEAHGRAVPEGFWAELERRLGGVPLCVLENATGAYRSGRGAWRADSLPVRVDAVWWYPGGQLGLCYLSDALWVPEPLTLISTWDGDEVSLTQLAWELREVCRRPIRELGAALGAALAPLGEVQGEGLYRTVECKNARGIADRLRARGFRLGVAADGALRARPPLDVELRVLERLEVAAREAVS